MTTPIWKTPADTRRRAREFLAREAAEQVASQPIYSNVLRFELSYVLPSTCGNEQDELRLHNEDLARLSKVELERERLRVSFALAFGEGGPPWAREWLYTRLQAIKIEQQRRQNDSKPR